MAILIPTTCRVIHFLSLKFLTLRPSLSLSLRLRFGLRGWSGLMGWIFGSFDWWNGSTDRESQMDILSMSCAVRCGVVLVDMTGTWWSRWSTKRTHYAAHGENEEMETSQWLMVHRWWWWKKKMRSTSGWVGGELVGVERWKEPSVIAGKAIFYIRRNLENAVRKLIIQTPSQTDTPSHIYMLVRNICTVHIR